MVASTELRTWPLTRPHRAAHGSVTERTSVLLRLELDGSVGWGEAAPLPSYDGGDAEACRLALESILPLIDATDVENPTAGCERLGGALPRQARAALSTALCDLSSRLAGLPLWRFLGGERPRPVTLSRLVGGATPEALGAAASEAVDSGYRCVKFKLGLADDIRNATAVREAVPSGVTVVGDANGSWDQTVAAARLSELRDGLVDLVEQPVRGVDAMRALASDADSSIALDEDATEPGALEPPPCAQAACIKLQAWGGVDRVARAAAASRAVGMAVYLGSTLDGPIGIAAALQSAAAIGPDLPSGLATLDSLVGRFDGVELADGQWQPCERPGLGVDPEGAPA